MFPLSATRVACIFASRSRSPLHLDSEVLIVDEVLAVGDGAFQEKCLGKMNDVAQGGRTVLFVSHNIDDVSDLCSRCLLID